MSTIVNRVMYPLQTSMNMISKMKVDFEKLQTQLATGDKAANLSELGGDRYFDLSIRARVSRLSGYKSNIQMVQSRLTMFSQLMSRLGSLEDTSRGMVTPSTYGSSNVIVGAIPTQARANLDEVINVLNGEINGRYLFGGGVTDKVPVADTESILNGANGKAGFSQVANERQQADVGSGTGRLDITNVGTQTTIAEDGTHPFGFKLSTITASSSAITVTAPTGSPPSETIDFTGVPADQDKINLGFTLPDGTSDGITMTAVTGTPASSGEFQIGADAATTAANFQAALASLIADKSETTLVAASNNQAANEFFNGQGDQVMRVQGPNFATATSLTVADPTTTVIWYNGGDSTDPRSAIQARVDDTQTVNYGAQANESGTLNLVRALSVLAVQTFSTSATSTAGRFDALASRNSERLSSTHKAEQGSIALVGIELNNAKVQVSDIQSRHDDYSTQLQGMLANIENTPDEETSMEILALQTRLTATYQATSMIANLSFVNFIK